jgi:hypothetical protein
MYVLAILGEDIFVAPCVLVGKAYSCCFYLEVDDRNVMMN